MGYSASDVRARERILRVLLVAPPKAGKTTVAMKTAPGPVFVLNTDGKGALDGLVHLGVENWEAEDITNEASFDRAMAYFKANQAKFKTIVFDNFMMYSETVFIDLERDLKDGRLVYPALKRALLKVVRTLFSFSHHVILIGQIDPAESTVAGSFGHMLSVAGKAKTAIPAMVQDWIYLDVSVDEHGAVKREFLLAPQGNWTKGARSVKDVPRMDADFTAFLELSRGLPTSAKDQKTENGQGVKPAQPMQKQGWSPKPRPNS